MSLIDFDLLCWSHDATLAPGVKHADPEQILPRHPVLVAIKTRGRVDAVARQNWALLNDRLIRFFKRNPWSLR